MRLEGDQKDLHIEVESKNILVDGVNPILHRKIAESIDFEKMCNEGFNNINLNGNQEQK
jgi:hypothetical protein